jgi:hypothetical protein
MPVRSRKFYPATKTSSDMKHSSSISIDENNSEETRGDQYYADLSSNDDLDSIDDKRNNNNEALKV